MREYRQVRSIPSAFQTREENEDLYIEGYFSVFNTDYELWPGATESVAPGAFSDTLGNDVRALIDHESRLVLGSGAMWTSAALDLTSLRRKPTTEMTGRCIGRLGESICMRFQL